MVEPGGELDREVDIEQDEVSSELRVIIADRGDRTHPLRLISRIQVLEGDDVGAHVEGYRGEDRVAEVAAKLPLELSREVVANVRSSLLVALGKLRVPKAVLLGAIGGNPLDVGVVEEFSGHLALSGIQLEIGWLLSRVMVKSRHNGEGRY